MFTAEGFQDALRYKDLFLQGLICTVLLSFFTVLFGFILALILAVLRLSNIRPFAFLAITKEGRLRGPGFLTTLSKFNPVSFLVTVYVEVIRATPLLVQLFIIYYVVLIDVEFPRWRFLGGIRFERFIPGVIAMSLNSAAYLSETIRSGIQSIDQGQTEAARSLGLSQLKNLRFVVLPQAIRNILPPIANEFVTIIKESSICYTIAVQDLMAAVWSVRSATFRIAEPLVIAAAVYFCLTFPTSKVIAYVERRMSNGTKR